MSHISRIRQKPPMIASKDPRTRVSPKDMIIVGTVKSESGKFHYFVGHHYNGTQTCWDVASLNTWTKELTKLHFSGEQAKADALVKWTELLERLTKYERERKEAADPEDSFVTLQ